MRRSRNICLSRPDRSVASGENDARFNPPKNRSAHPKRGYLRKEQRTRNSRGARRWLSWVNRIDFTMSGSGPLITPKQAKYGRACTSHSGPEADIEDLWEKNARPILTATKIGPQKGVGLR